MSALSARCRKFRESAGAICWDRREGSDRIKAFIEDIVKPVNNSTRASRDLTEDEVGALRLVNYGTKPSRARAGTTQESKQKYAAVTLKAAGVNHATGTWQEEDEEVEETQQEAGAIQRKADDRNRESPQAEAGETHPEINDEVDETQQVEEGEPESQSHQGRSNRGWEVNYLLDYDGLYDDDKDDHFVENPLASEDSKRPHYSKK